MDLTPNSADLQYLSEALSITIKCIFSFMCYDKSEVFIQGLADCIKRRSTADRTSVNPNWSVMSASVILPMLERSEASLEFPT